MSTAHSAVLPPRDATFCEHLYIRDRRGEEEVDRLLAHEEETGIEEYFFEGGYAMLLDKEIYLTFGEDSQRFIEPQEET